MQRVNQLADEQSDHDLPVGELDYVKAERKIYRRKGKWQRFSDEQEATIENQQEQS